MNKKFKLAGLVIAFAIVYTILFGGVFMSDVEQASYQSYQSTTHGIETRLYPPTIVAEVSVAGERKKAINTGFRMIADYIFGNNIKAEKVAMTAPVLQAQAEGVAEKIAMTAPVLQEQSADSEWVVKFVMPKKYEKIEELPKPKNDAVKLKLEAAKKFAVIRFSGIADDKKLTQKTAELREFIREKKLKELGLPQFAFYNPPWTMPFFRRNEVMIQIE